MRNFKISRIFCRERGIKSVSMVLKGSKREKYVAGIFAQIRPIWIGDLGTRPKNPKKKFFFGKTSQSTIDSFWNK